MSANSLAAPSLRIYVEGSGITSIINLCTSHEIVRSNQIVEYMWCCNFSLIFIKLTDQNKYLHRQRTFLHIVKEAKMFHRSPRHWQGTSASCAVVLWSFSSLSSGSTGLAYFSLWFACINLFIHAYYLGHCSSDSLIRMHFAHYYICMIFVFHMLYFISIVDSIPSYLLSLFLFHLFFSLLCPSFHLTFNSLIQDS